MTLSDPLSLFRGGSGGSFPPPPLCASSQRGPTWFLPSAAYPRPQEGGGVAIPAPSSPLSMWLSRNDSTRGWGLFSHPRKLAFPGLGVRRRAPGRAAWSPSLMCSSWLWSSLQHGEGELWISLDFPCPVKSVLWGRPCALSRLLRFTRDFCLPSPQHHLGEQMMSSGQQLLTFLGTDSGNLRGFMPPLLFQPPWCNESRYLPHLERRKSWFWGGGVGGGFWGGLNCIWLVALGINPLNYCLYSCLLRAGEHRGSV